MTSDIQMAGQMTDLSHAPSDDIPAEAADSLGLWRMHHPNPDHLTVDFAIPTPSVRQLVTGRWQGRGITLAYALFVAGFSLPNWEVFLFLMLVPLGTWLAIRASPARVQSLTMDRKSRAMTVTQLVRGKQKTRTIPFAAIERIDYVPRSAVSHRGAYLWVVFNELAGADGLAIHHIGLTQDVALKNWLQAMLNIPGTPATIDASYLSGQAIFARIGSPVASTPVNDSKPLRRPWLILSAAVLLYLIGRWLQLQYGFDPPYSVFFTGIALQFMVAPLLTVWALLRYANDKYRNR